jgi:hypothetical protein
MAMHRCGCSHRESLMELSNQLYALTIDFSIPVRPLDAKVPENSPLFLVAQ